MNKNVLVKQMYYRTLSVLVSIIVLLAVCLTISIQIRPEPEIIEVEKIVTKEVVVETEKEVIVEVAVEPTYTYEITSEEREMLARLVHREANTESLECQQAVISVVINRWRSGRWGNTLDDVVYAQSQFSPSNILYRTTPNETNYQAVDKVIKDGTTLPLYVMYFRSNYHFKWSGYNAYAKIGSTYFGYFNKDKQ